MNLPPVTRPTKVRRGDKVAVLSPSSGLPQLFPYVHERGLRRLRDDLLLEPVEYPTTRTMDASPADRARDIHAAFADPDITAVLATIGGDDQVKVLRHLDPDLLRAHPKPFYGYSDNTNLLGYLWNLGIAGYHGGSVMVHLGRPGGPHPYSMASLRTALFDSGEVEVRPASEYGDEEIEWAPDALDDAPRMFASDGWRWRNADRVVSGVTWGGCLEILAWQLAVGRYVQPVAAYEGAVLLVETSEEMPSATEVYRALMCMGERGLLQQFAAVLVGRPKAWSREQRNSPEAKRRYVADQAAAIERALDEYHPGVPTVFGLDIGHTDPQLVVPHGGRVRIDGPARRIWFTY